MADKKKKQTEKPKVVLPFQQKVNPFLRQKMTAQGGFSPTTFKRNQHRG